MSRLTSKHSSSVISASGAISLYTPVAIVYTRNIGEVQEWLNWPLSKSGEPQGSEGSNPSLSAMKIVEAPASALFVGGIGDRYSHHPLPQYGPQHQGTAVLVNGQATHVLKITPVGVW